jgi:hypothetical protein
MFWLCKAIAGFEIRGHSHTPGVLLAEVAELGIVRTRAPEG